MGNYQRSTFNIDKKSSSSEDEDEEESYPAQVVNKGIGELPPGAQLSDSNDEDAKDADDPHRALNIDLDLPLQEDERLPVVEHRVSNANILSTPEKPSTKKGKVSLSCFIDRNIP